ncbi:MAG: hypothetical protein ACTSYA_01930 [Candidatus Kariarchaeaceae archaeon]
MNRKIVLLTFVSILLFSFIPTDTSAQTMVNPFEKYDMMFWDLDSNMYTTETETMIETNQLDHSEIYHISENLWDGYFAAYGNMDMLVSDIGVIYESGETFNSIDIIGQGYQDLDETFSYENMDHNDWDTATGWNNWSDSFTPKFKPEMESFTDTLIMNETYIPLGVPDEPDYHSGGGPGPFWFLDQVMLDFDMTELFVTPGNTGYETNINGMDYTLTVTYVEASYSADHTGIYGFNWGPFSFDVTIDMTVDLTYELIYDEATGMMISHNQYVDRTLTAFYTGVQHNGVEDVYIEFSYNQISVEYIYLNLNAITVPILFNGHRFGFVTDGPALIGDYFETDGYQSDGQYSHMIVEVTDSTTDELLHKDVRSDYRYNDADIYSLMTIFQITDTDLGVINENEITDLGGTYGWAEYNYDLNQGGFLRNDSDDTSYPSMGTYYQSGFDIVPYEDSHIPIFYYPDTISFDKWEFMQGSDMWVDPFGGDDEVVLTKTSTTSTFLKTYEINGFTFKLLVEYQKITYQQSFTVTQSIPLGDDGEDTTWVTATIDTEILIEFEHYYDTETGMIVEMGDYSMMTFSAYADETIPPASPTLDLQATSMDIVIDMYYEAYNDFGWEITDSTFMYLDEQTDIPTDDPTDDPTNNQTDDPSSNDTESTLSPIPVLELAFIAPVGMIIAIVRRRK